MTLPEILARLKQLQRHFELVGRTGSKQERPTAVIDALALSAAREALSALPEATERAPSAWTEFGDGHDYSRTGKHDPDNCRSCLRFVRDKMEAFAKQSPLPRYAAAGNGDDEPLLTPSPDGYWTPWHIAVNASRAALSAQGWQPIASAPQMRKVIVFYRNALGKGRCVMACYYKANSLEMHDDYAEVGTFDEASGKSYAPEGWYEEHDSEEPLMPLQEQPTHWMPLPPSPPTEEPS